MLFRCRRLRGFAMSIGRSKDGHYRVRLEGEWLDVPDEAVITEPNRVGRTMVWPITRLWRDRRIRCFMPGSMT